MNWINSAIVSIVATVLSLFGVHQIKLPPIASSTVEIQQTVANTSVSETSVITGVPAGWKSYQDTGWGFQISYPPNLRFVSDTENLNGPTHYLVPQIPYAQSGYAGKLLEIADGQSTSTLRGELQVTFMPFQPTSLDSLDTYVQAAVATSTASSAKAGTTLAFKRVTIGNTDFPAISITSIINNETKQGMWIYYYIASSTIYGKPQPSKVFRIEYASNGESVFSQIASTMKTIPIVISDAMLSESAQESKDPSWCDKISDSLIKRQCFIVLRGYPIFDYYPVSLDTVAAKNGTVQFVGTSTVVLSATKAPGDKTGVAWVSLVVTPTTPWDMIDIEPVFTNGKESEGLLTVLWDTQTLGQDDGRLGDMSAVGGYGAMYIGTSTYASHVLGLRFDTFGTSTGSVKISNMKAEVIH